MLRFPPKNRPLTSYATILIFGRHVSISSPPLGRNTAERVGDIWGGLQIENKIEQTEGVTMENVHQDLMYDAIARMKFGMTVKEAQSKGICIKCRRIVTFEDRQYEALALCPDCSIITGKQA